MLDLLAVEPVFTRSAYHVQLTMRDRPPLHGLAAAARAAPGTDRQTDGHGTAFKRLLYTRSS